MSKLTDYAMVILAEIARHPKERMSASTLSGLTHLPEPTVSKILKLLNKADILKSMRGAAGGYLLNEKPEDLSLERVITAMEGPIALVSCVSTEEDPCAIEHSCQMKGCWSPVNDAFRQALNNVTLRQLMDQARPDQPAKTG